MPNPNDDPDVISGLCDDAQKEMATNPGPSHSLADKRPKWLVPEILSQGGPDSQELSRQRRGAAGNLAPRQT